MHRALAFPIDENLDLSLAGKHEEDVVRLETQPQARVGTGDDAGGLDRPPTRIRELVRSRGDAWEKRYEASSSKMTPPPAKRSSRA